MAFRKEKIAAHVAELAAQFVRQRIKDVLITVTRVDISDEAGHATVLCTVFPDKEQADALKTLQKDIAMFRRLLAEKMRIKRIPTIMFAADIGEENRRAVEELLKTT